MHFTSSLVALVAATGASFVSAANMTVMVAANGQLQFTPNTVTAAAGDFVVFQFEASGHSATQTSFQAPCTALSGGVNSGFSSVTSATLPTFSYAVKDTNPVWFMCSQVGHCAAGMVFAINPNSTETFAAFQAAATGGSTPSAASTTASAVDCGSTPASSAAGGGYGYAVCSTGTTSTSASTPTSGARDSKVASVGLSILALGLGLTAATLH
ncbi:hypothetical protein FRB96_002390 [Tulasnella sp. 330]|nr:hypothetical protein FRB96_002390 [Tulasnella sp. 330]KAG8883094.1 hypothetical protein FRB97_007231 [Tulasnella sp. 331]